MQQSWQRSCRHVCVMAATGRRDPLHSRTFVEVTAPGFAPLPPNVHTNWAQSIAATVPPMVDGEAVIDLAFGAEALPWRGVHATVPIGRTSPMQRTGLPAQNPLLHYVDIRLGNCGHDSAPSRI